MVQGLDTSRTPRTLAQPPPYQRHGIWQGLQPIGPDQYVGWAFTLDATPSHYDSRSQIWVFGLCVHTQSMGQPKRLGAIAGVAQGQQTEGRGRQKRGAGRWRGCPSVQLSSVWEAWTNNHTSIPTQTSLKAQQNKTGNALQCFTSAARHERLIHRA